MDQICLPGNLSQRTIPSLSDTTMSSLNNLLNKNNSGEKYGKKVHMLTPEKKKEIYDKQYNILKKVSCKKGKKRKADVA